MFLLAHLSDLHTTPLDLRSPAELMGKRALGWIYFHDEGTPVPDDFVNSNDQIIMHMPSSMAENVIGTLRNEKPVSIGFAFGHAVLSTGSELVGEEEA